MRFKSLLSAGIATALLSGCSQNEVIDTPMDNVPDGIEFASTVAKTRGVETNMDALVTTGELRMYNYKLTGEFKNHTGTLSKFFDNQPEVLKYAPVTKGWNTEKNYKWSALGEEKLNIFGVYPNTIDLTDPVAAKGPSFTYKVEGLTKDQADVVVSANIDVTKDNSNGRVVLSYKHILSQVYFKAKLSSETYKVKITDIQLLGVSSEGTFTFNATNTAGPIGSWSAVGGAAINPFYIESGVTSYESATAEVVGSDNGNLMLIPQPAVSKTFKLSVVYDVLDKTTNEVISKDVKKTADMEALEMGKKYAYVLTLSNDNDDIRFSVEVSDWDSEVIEYDRKFDDIVLQDGKNIAAKVKDFAKEISARENPKKYVHTVKVTGSVKADGVTIDLKGIDDSKVPTGSQIILDFSSLTFDSNAVTITHDSSKWSISPANVVSAAGTVKLTKI